MGKKITLLVLSIILVLTILIGTTYSALFKVDEGVEQSYATGNLEIISNATNGSVTLTNSLPMEDSIGATSTPYTFKITNTGNLSYKFNVKFLSTTTDLENMINPENIKIKVNDNEIMTFYSLSLNDGIILENIELEPRKSIEITIRVWLDINTQNTEIGKVFNAKIVTEGQAFYTDELASSPSYAVLSRLNLTDSIQTDTPDFTKTSCSSGCQEATVGIYSMEDDLGTSYYFRGDVENNYVYFANLFWRIIRINGDGTVRMIYDGTTANENGISDDDSCMGTGYFSSDYNIDYLESNILRVLEDVWYNNLSDSYKQHIANAIYCNKKEIISESKIETPFGFEVYPKYFDRNNPSLVCPRVEDRYTLIDSPFETLDGLGTSKNLNIPVGLITADEIVLAGINGENANNYLSKSYIYWSMTPDGGRDEIYTDNSERIFIWRGFAVQKAGILDFEDMTSYSCIRPVISLNSDALIYNEVSNGSREHPFVVE